MKIAIVNPIAVSPELTPRAMARGTVPSLASSPQRIREMNIVELGAAFARLGHSTSLMIAEPYLDGRAWDLAPGLRVVPVPTFLRVPFHPGVLPMTPGLAGHPALRDADVIQAGEFHQPSTFFSAVAARGAGIPFVVWQETFRPMRFPGCWYQRGFEFGPGRHIRSTTRRFVPRTTKARGYLRKLGVREDAITSWIPTGIDVTTFAPRRSDYSAEDFGWAAGTRILLQVARLHPTKGVDVSLQVLKRLLRDHPDVGLVVAGSGPDLVNLRMLATQLGIVEAVRFVGHVSREKMVHLYNAADLVLSLSRNDLLPFALIEAAACARPCIATDVGAVRDIVVDGVSGHVLETPSVDGVAQVIRDMFRDDGREATMGARARERAETHFNIEEVAKSLLEVYASAAR